MDPQLCMDVDLHSGGHSADPAIELGLATDMVKKLYHFYPPHYLDEEVGEALVHGVAAAAPAAGISRPRCIEPGLAREMRRASAHIGSDCRSPPRVAELAGLAVHTAVMPEGLPIRFSKVAAQKELEEPRQAAAGLHPCNTAHSC
jgi:hypothetical protein